MKPRRSPILLLGILVAAGSIALGAESPEPELLSVRIVPETVELEGAGATRQLLVMGRYSDRLERDVTSLGRWEFSNAGVAAVSPGGKVEALAEGVTNVTARLGSRSATVRLRVEGGADRPPLSFAWDVERILTRRGCNDTHCHGGVKGRGGFKLSLFGIYPEEDYRWIVKGGTYQVLSPDPGTEIPRIDRDEPEKSLLLRKPTLAEPHQGGLQLPPESEDYKTLLRWVKEGAPFRPAAASSPGVGTIEVYPAEAVLEVGGGQQLLVSALLRNGTRRDLTGQVRYLAENSEVVEVDPDGRLRGLRPGETFVTVRTAGHSTTARVSVIEETLARYPGLPARNFIDRLVFDKLSRLHRIPSELSGDAEFLRRVCLDLTGTLPPPPRTREFLQSTDPDKREKLVDTLLQTPEFVDYWTYRLSQLFRVALFENGINLPWTEAYWEWIRGHVAGNTPYDQVARERIAAIGYSPPSRHFLPNGEVRYPQNKMAEEVRVFLGRRLDCAECHNHPLENYTQDDFYGLAAFFARLKVKHGYGEYRRTWYVDEEGEVEHPVTKQQVAPKFLGGDTPDIPNGADRREVLADWIVSPDNPYFARATVNRLWHQYFGTGIVEPYDDFRSTNRPSNPELLDRLAEFFVSNGYRLKPLHRVILNSRTYQLSSHARDPSALGRTLFASYEPRKVPAEVLLDMLSQVTGIPHPFDGYPAGTSAKDIYVPDGPDYFLVTFGLPRRDILKDRAQEPTLSQALHLMNGPTVRDKVEARNNILEELLRQDGPDDKVVAALYERAYARLPSQTEQARVTRFIADEKAAGRSRRRAFENVLWAVLNSEEFQLNH